MVEADGLEVLILLSFADAVDLDGEGTLLQLFVEKDGKSCEPIDVMDGDRLKTEEEIEVEGAGLAAKIFARQEKRATIK